MHNASHKMQNPIDKMFFLGFLAGIWVGLGGIAGTRHSTLTSCTNIHNFTRNRACRRNSGGCPSTVAKPQQGGNRPRFPFRFTFHSPIRWRTLHWQYHDSIHRPLESIHTGFQSPRQSAARVVRQFYRMSDMRLSVLLQSRAVLQRALLILCERLRVHQSQRSHLGRYFPTRHSGQHTRMHGSHARFRCKRQCGQNHGPLVPRCDVRYTRFRACRCEYVFHLQRPALWLPHNRWMDVLQSVCCRARKPHRRCNRHGHFGACNESLVVADTVRTRSRSRHPYCWRRRIHPQGKGGSDFSREAGHERPCPSAEGSNDVDVGKSATTSYDPPYCYNHVVDTHRAFTSK